MKISSKRQITEYTTIQEIENLLKTFCKTYKRLTLHNTKIFEKFLTLTFTSHKEFKIQLCSELGIKRWDM